VVNVLQEFSIEPSCLEFELTEHAVVHPGSDEIAHTLEELHDVGAGIALDDFGTGQSSLMLLKRLPVDRIKIDRSFVGGIDTNAHDVAIVRGIVELGLSLELGVTAEGVERLEQLDFLRATGCPEAQGYFVASPMSGQCLVEFLRGGACLPLQGRAGCGAAIAPPRH
jgi:EAL domain-containing protein (putative c-di-GMP-specific phosphodiesterase class I)